MSYIITGLGCVIILSAGAMFLLSQHPGALALQLVITVAASALTSIARSKLHNP